MLTCVTLTGADNSVEPDDLRELSNEFPFVEWGILVGSNFGNRFPTLEWIHKLIECRVDSGNRMKLSLHICGRHLRDLSEGRPRLMAWIGPMLCAFDRCQLNWHGERQANIGESILHGMCELTPWEPEVIFQLDGVNNRLWEATARRFLVSGLFDASHGAGVLPGEWPKGHEILRCGWAGGLGPDNVVQEVPKIDQQCHKIYQHWIDMETKLRATDDDFFDLGKCRDVLEKVKPFVVAP